MQVNNDSQINDIQSKYNKLRDMIIRGEQEVVNLKKAKIAEQSEMQRLIKYVEVLKQDIERYSKESEELTKDIGKLKLEHAHIKDNIKISQAENNTLSTAKIGLEANIDILRDNIRLFLKEQKELQDKLSKLEKEYNEKRSKVEKLIEKAKDILKVTLVVFILPITLVFGVFQLYENVVDTIIVESKQ